MYNFYIKLSPDLFTKGKTMQVKIFKTNKTKKITIDKIEEKMNQWLREQKDIINTRQIFFGQFPLDNWGIGFEAGYTIFYD